MQDSHTPVPADETGLPIWARYDWSRRLPSGCPSGWPVGWMSTCPASWST